MTADERAAVVAHGLLNRMTAVTGGIDVALRADDLPTEVVAVLRAAKRQADLVAESLVDLVQGRVPEVVAGPEISVVDLDQT